MNDYSFLMLGSEHFNGANRASAQQAKSSNTDDSARQWSSPTGLPQGMIRSQRNYQQEQNKLLSGALPLPSKLSRAKAYLQSIGGVAQPGVLNRWLSACGKT
jgi:hypothetical protein